MGPEVERELIRKCKAGDSRFYEPLVRAYEQPGLRLALGMLGNREDARDALQNAFIKAYDALGRFDLKRPFGPWFFQILRNQCRDQLRTRKARFRLDSASAISSTSGGMGKKLASINANTKRAGVP